MKILLPFSFKIGNDKCICYLSDFAIKYLLTETIMFNGYTEEQLKEFINNTPCCIAIEDEYKEQEIECDFTYTYSRLRHIYLTKTVEDTTINLCEIHVPPGEVILEIFKYVEAEEENSGKIKTIKEGKKRIKRRYAKVANKYCVQYGLPRRIKKTSR